MRLYRPCIQRALLVGVLLSLLPLSAFSPVASSASSVDLKPLAAATGSPHGRVQTVFVIMMENHNWSSIKGSTAAPYINTLLASSAASANQYYNPPSLHPSEPNYLWLEAGTNFGITDDSGPSSNHQRSHAHLTAQLANAHISWKAYQEDIAPGVCPLESMGDYAPKHNPMVFFDDVTGGNNPHSAYCIAHMRPYSELAPDLTHHTVARYNFITPNLCHDMHDDCGGGAIQNGDAWLARAVPQIMVAPAYSNGGAILILWDEGEGSDGPVGMIVLSPLAKRGYTNSVHYTHSSTLRTLQEIFGVRPFLGDAAHAADLRDLFQPGAF